MFGNFLLPDPAQTGLTCQGPLVTATFFQTLLCRAALHRVPGKCLFFPLVIKSHLNQPLEQPLGLCPLASHTAPGTSLNGTIQSSSRLQPVGLLAAQGTPGPACMADWQRSHSPLYDFSLLYNGII